MELHVFPIPILPPTCLSTRFLWIFPVHQPRWDAWDKCSGLVHWEDPEESGGEAGGREDPDGEYM